MLQAVKAALHQLIKSCRRTGWFHYICCFSHMDNASALPAYINVAQGPELLPRKCFFNCWQMPWRVRYGGAGGGEGLLSPLVLTQYHSLGHHPINLALILAATSDR